MNTKFTQKKYEKKFAQRRRSVKGNQCFLRSRNSSAADIQLFCKILSEIFRRDLIG